RVWRSIGFDPSFTAARDVELASGDAGVIADTATSGLVSRSGSTDRAVAPAFAAPLPGECRFAAVPVTISGDVVGIVYADEGAATTEIPSGRPSGSWMAVVEILARHAARCLEAIIALKATRALTGQADPGSSAADDTADEQ